MEIAERCKRFALFFRPKVTNIKESIKAKLIVCIYDLLTLDHRYSGVPLAHILGYQSTMMKYAIPWCRCQLSHHQWTRCRHPFSSRVTQTFADKHIFLGKTWPDNTSASNVQTVRGNREDCSNELGHSKY